MINHTPAANDEDEMGGTPPGCSSYPEIWSEAEDVATVTTLNKREAFVLVAQRDDEITREEVATEIGRSADKVQQMERELDVRQREVAKDLQRLKATYHVLNGGKPQDVKMRGGGND